MNTIGSGSVLNLPRSARLARMFVAAKSVNDGSSATQAAAQCSSRAHPLTLTPSERQQRAERYRVACDARNDFLIRWFCFALLPATLAFLFALVVRMWHGEDGLVPASLLQSFVIYGAALAVVGELALVTYMLATTNAFHRAHEMRCGVCATLVPEQDWTEVSGEADAMGLRCAHCDHVLVEGSWQPFWVR
jgi:hypothetical protein